MNSNDDDFPPLEAYADEPIGVGTTTLDMLYVQHPWLREMHDVQDQELNEAWDDIIEQRQEILRLRERNRNQKQELRRLNAAHVMKNARVANLERDLAAALNDNKNLLSTVRGFLMGEIQVVRPFTAQPALAPAGPDLMSMVTDMAREIDPGNSPS